jgi:hypothetical protein
VAGADGSPGSAAPIRRALTAAARVIETHGAELTTPLRRARRVISLLTGLNGIRVFYPS